jgi:hypothetical protein
MSKPKKYHVVIWHRLGESNGLEHYAPHWLCEWPDDPSKWGARYETSPKKEEALAFGRDTAIEIANTIRMRNGSWAMVEEA